MSKWDLLQGAIYVAMASGCLLVLYSIVWFMAYPDLGRVCTVRNTVRSTKLTGHSAWDGDHYTTTFTDGSQATTGYVKPGSAVCIKTKTNFWFWSKS